MSFDRRRALMGGEKSSARIPAAYQEVEWVGANNDTFAYGKTTVDTGFVPKSQAVKIETDILVPDNDSRIVFGFYDTNLPRWQITTYKGLVYYRMGANSQILPTPTILSGSWYHVACGKQFYFNGALVGTVTDYDFSANDRPLHLFAAASVRSKAQIKEVKIIDGETVVHDFVPCYRKSDGRIGFFDTVGEKFITNSGGAVTDLKKGADVK